MADGEGVVDGMVDFSVSSVVDGVQGAADLVTDAAKTVASVGLATAKGVWNAPKAIGLKPVPTILAAGAGVAAASASTGAGAATGIGVSLPHATPVLAGFGIAVVSGAAAYGVARKYRAVRKKIKVVDADPDLRALRTSVKTLRRSAPGTRIRQTAANVNDRLARRQQRKLMRRAHRLGEPKTVQNPANISRKSRALMSTDRRARRARRKEHARRAAATRHALGARGARARALRTAATRRLAVRRKPGVTLPPGRTVQRMLGFSLGRSKGLG